MPSAAPARALVALSGGVDSSVAALIAQHGGMQVTSVTLALPGADLTCAHLVAQRLSIEHRVVSAEAILEREVIGPFLDEYERGRTPNPCVLCNPNVKFRVLLEWADRLSCETVITGHYAQIQPGNGEFHLLKGVDARKDQSYVLYRLSQEMLARASFPVGGLTKRQVREKAAAAGLPTAERAASQDICFVTDGDTAGFIRARRPQAMRPGPIVDRDGVVVGGHAGLAAYTVGQRRGLGIGGPEGPCYVLEMRPEDNTLVVGAEEELWAEQCTLDEVHLVGSPPGDKLEAEVMTRYRGMSTPAEIQLAGDRAVVSFQRPHRAPAPGQAAVFYQGERLIGGGTIRSVE